MDSQHSAVRKQALDKPRMNTGWIKSNKKRRDTTTITVVNWTSNLHQFSVLPLSTGYLICTKTRCPVVDLRPRPLPLFCDLSGGRPQYYSQQTLTKKTLLSFPVFIGKSPRVMVGTTMLVIRLISENSTVQSKTMFFLKFIFLCWLRKVRYPGSL